MRILYVQQHFATNRGEAGVRGYNLVKTLADRGHDVTVVCGYNWRDSSLKAEDGNRVIELDLDGFHVVQLAVYYSNHQSFLARIWSFLLFGFLACRETVRRKADVVYASSTPLTVSIPALCARVLRGTPYIFEVRDLWPDLPIAMRIITNPLVKWALLAWEWIAYRCATRLVALAPGIKDGIHRKAGVALDRIAMVPNGSDTESIEPLPRSPRRMIPIGEDVLVCGYTGTHGLANGLDAVLDAAAELKRRSVSDVAFALVGDGREKARLVERARAEGLDNVHFLGLVNKTGYSRLLADLDVGMQILANVPAFYYGTSPNKFFDYLAAGRPVLVNYPGWMADIVTDGKCGVAVAPDSPVAFADAVVELARDRDRLVAMGANARSVAESQFSQRKILAQLAEFIEGLDPHRETAAAPERIASNAP